MGWEAVRTPEQLLAKAAEFLPPQLIEYVKGQITKAVTSKKGRRFRVQERKFALGILYHSPKTYRYLSSMFMLPSVSALHSWLRKIMFNVGWSKQTLAILKRK